ncbi:MAG: hypothetical protein GX639_01420 [Fibrobacter sp.]|nr:hypothetical protein [Fibrobacter sp.]
MITFFRPEFLWALLFVIAVIIVHLIRRPRFTLLSFSTLMFFTSDAVMSSKNRRLFKLLQLLMRILALITIILLFARPYHKNNVLSVIKNPNTPLYFWIDNTISMSYVTDSGALSDIAINCVKKTASLKGSNTVYLFSNQAQEFVSVDDSFETADKYYGENNFHYAIHSFLKVSRQKENAVLFIVSDFHKSSVDFIDSIVNENDTLKNGIVFMSVTPQSPYNIVLYGAEMQNGTVYGSLSQLGGKKDTLRVHCVINEIEKGSVSVITQPDSAISFSIETGSNSNTSGYLQIKVTDPLLFDNIDYFTDNFKLRKKISIIGDTNANYTLRAAIHAANKNTLVNLYTERDVTFSIIDSSDVIIINALRHPSGALNAFIMSKGTHCKSIICCVDPSENYSGYYRDILSKAFNDGALSLQSVHNSKANPVLSDTLTDMWRNFRSLRIDDVEIYSYVSGINGTILLRYTTNDPFLIYKQDTQQRDWVIATTSLGITVDNTLFQRSFYLPLIDRTILFTGKLKKNSDHVWTCGKEIKNPFFDLRKKNLLYNSRGDFVENLSELFRITPAEPGIYKVVAENSDAVFVKVQHDSLESILLYRSPDNFIENREHWYAGSCRELMQVLDSSNKVDFEMFLWLFLTLFLLGEIVFSIRR